MKKPAFALLAASLMLPACATPAYVSPVDVTRFVGDAPAFLGQGTIQIVPAAGLEAESIEYGIYRDAVRLELEEMGYRVVMVNGSQTAQLGIDQYVLDEGNRRGPVGVGVGGSTGTYGSGLGVGIGFNLGGKPSERIAREMVVSIRQAGGDQNLWEGRATMTVTANSDYAADAAAAPRLADALFSGFPGTSGETISVE
ncbi:DUF4136 domain-containing protein [Aurantiacibacter rhizosphaerae]|uniref:DUF4136 domain-containing protein n=1 Tax=Aurantiacibacter rhizosphaerae TaxID=2691582 RepID=A0A844XBA2_9SPHN|nr:DUF4136 domain-containing protein [Aurantiacibacter rhizosphaerae]MWV26914.1 DUF4136 domain-containing protein [Aurantiacibacter rhizosphaerae]